jgi:hypothetical protein
MYMYRVILFSRASLNGHVTRQCDFKGCPRKRSNQVCCKEAREATVSQGAFITSVARHCAIYLRQAAVMACSFFLYLYHSIKKKLQLYIANITQITLSIRIGVVSKNLARPLTAVAPVHIDKSTECSLEGPRHATKTLGLAVAFLVDVRMYNINFVFCVNL